ncbi:MAG: PH domain-containing protein [Gemmatimonadales bacterium]|jgi:putative membrane protein
MNGLDREGDWRRLHPATPFLRSAQLLYALVFAAIAARLGGPGLIVLVISAALVAALITASYLRYRYRLTDDGLIIQHGVLFRQRRVVPRSRIQNVDLRAGLFLQILGVVTARVETAGGQGSEAALHVVSREEGRRLRESLVARPAASPQPLSRPAVYDWAGADDMSAVAVPVQLAPDHAAVDVATETVVQKVTVRDLIIAGATSNRAGLLVAALLGGDYFLDILPTDWLLRKILPAEFMQPEAAVTSLVETAQHDLRAFAIGVIVLVLFFGLAGWGLSVLASVIRFYDFTLSQSGGEIRVAYGSFTRREKGFRCSRVQNVQVEEPIIRRWFGLASVKVQTAGYGPTVKADDRIETLTPIVRHADIAPYLQLIHPELSWQDVEWRPSHPRARRRLFLRRAFLVVVVTGALTAVIGTNGLAFILALIPAWFLATLHYRHLGHAWTRGHMLVREGLWTRRTYIVPIRKIQSLHFKQTPFQRRLNLGTLIMETAGSPIEWHSPRSIDLGRDYGLALMDRLGAAVRRTGLVF